MPSAGVTEQVDGPRLEPDDEGRHIPCVLLDREIVAFTDPIAPASNGEG